MVYTVYNIDIWMFITYYYILYLYLLVFVYVYLYYILYSFKAVCVSFDIVLYRFYL